MVHEAPVRSSVVCDHSKPFSTKLICYAFWMQFVSALALSDGFELFASDYCILQVLVDLTTGKKLNDMAHGDKCVVRVSYLITVACDYQDISGI